MGHIIVSSELPSANFRQSGDACVKVFVKKGNVQPVSDILWLIKPAWVFSPGIRGLPSCLAEEKRTKHFIAVLVQECSRFKTTYTKFFKSPLRVSLTDGRLKSG